jgi:hypothetical protein
MRLKIGAQMLRPSLVQAVKFADTSGAKRECPIFCV